MHVHTNRNSRRWRLRAPTRVPRLWAGFHIKEALTTGWDCPRAEVMLSLRGAKDQTYISQLVGRMVRSPLARRIESSELLNRVSLFLPGFSETAVEQIKAQLEADPEGPPTDVEIEPEKASRNTDKTVAPAFACFEGSPSYSTASAVHRSQVARLHRLAGLLLADGILEDAVSAADDYLIGVLNTERQRLDNEGRLTRLVNDVETSTLRIEEVAVLNPTEGDVSEVEVSSDIVDLERLFDASKRQFKDGLSRVYWAHLVSVEDIDPLDAKILVTALSHDSDTVENVEDSATSLVKKWQNTYGNQISNLSDDQRAHYQDVRAMAKAPELIYPRLPKEPISMSGDDSLPEYEKHLFVGAGKTFRTKLATWEEHALEVEMNRPGFIAWYRNPVGGQRCLRIPYQDGDTWKSVYPDIIVFHKTETGDIRASIVDPHGHHLADAGNKLRGLAEYAAEHGHEFARITAVIRDKKDNYHMLDMTDPTVQTEVQQVASPEEIEALFKDHGSAYA